ncbi:hypothetical protein KJZ61_01655 [Candidatus Dependentiae bacterium]|jgi:hypothetical protein|nr:hypothetical protein [Candidatus Dependentiae bacterium]
MGICVDITKCYETENRYVYRVQHIGVGVHEFYVALSAGEKIISFYSDLELKNFLRALDMSNLDEQIYVPGIPTKTICCVLSKCLEAIDNNYFPENIGYYA